MNGIVRLGLATATALGLAACGVEAPTGPADASPARPIPGVDGSPLASRVQGPRPLRGSLDGIGVAGDPCSVDPPGLMITATAKGTVSHLGATTLMQSACVAVADFTPLGPSGAILTAANGDQVAGLVTGLVFGADGFEMDITISGGSGRFAQAGGEYTAHVVQSAPLTPFSATIEGWIEY